MEECLLKNDLHEIGYIGPKFTWYNNKVGSARILERLDRCFVNTMALNSPFKLIERHLDRIASDHCPILLQFKNFNTNPRKMIKFENCWACYQASYGIVRKEWDKNYQGSFSEVLNKKFQRTLKSLFFWSKAKHKELNNLKEVLIQEITEIQCKETSIGSLPEQEQWNLKTKVMELNATMARLNMWWKQRAKVKWLSEGDGNSKFFHTYASARRNANKIIKIKDEDGMVIEDQSLIEEVFIRFFQKKWEARRSNLEGWPTNYNSLNSCERNMLEADLSMNEIEEVVQHLEGNISPGNDGINHTFIKVYWEFIKDDFCKAIKFFFSYGELDKAWKETLIVLIPKITNPIIP
ncbi:uncharacterized protein LOC114579317 [Dendrobium catenatum]|uniref:uncharacterized protein LOC114579317 n=1 Tax=Dendrobium catenatum TaxID=906689 RepID=UPI00109F1238|nr:uncharacterized protein LOC114579317 [Dendrobium catenatum]